MAEASRSTKAKAKPDMVDHHVGKRLRMRRSLLGLSQEKLAEQVKLTFQQVQKYERGVNRISAGRLYELSNILEVPVSYFYEGYEDEEKTSEIVAQIDSDLILSEDMLYSRETLDLVRLYYSIKDKSKRQEVFKILKSMVKSMNTEV